MTAPRFTRVDAIGGDGLETADHTAVSWSLPDGAVSQLAYRVRTDDGYDSGHVDSPVQSFVVIPDRSGRESTVQVQVISELGESEWSEPLRLVVDPTEAWTAPWTTVDEPEQLPKGDRPAYWLRTTFEGAAADAHRLRVSALGMYEVFLNGERVGDHELAPGYTQYRARVPGQCHDVSGAVRPGRNVIAVLLADGWFRGQLGMPRAADQFGTEVALRLQLEARHDDTWSLVAGTDEGWTTSASHIVAADLIAGQREDRRLFERAVHDASYDDSAWNRAPTRTIDTVIVTPVAAPVRRVDEIEATSVVERPDGAVIIDLGQNINGWLRVGNLGPAGTTLTIRHGEHLDTDGELTTTHLDVDIPILPERLPVGQVDQVISAGVADDVFEPRFTTHGFRFARVEGHPGGLTAADVTGVVVHSDLRRIGWFECSDEGLNRLHEAAVWSLRDNMCGIPTDCPQRERAGWTGDWQVFAGTAAFVYDVLGFTRSWLRDVALDQRADGCVANMSPCPPVEGFDGPLGFLNGSAGWGDVVVSAPWDLYQLYGDEELLRETWASAPAWVDYAINRAATERHPARQASRPSPAEHEKYLWDSGFHWGERLEPDVDLSDFGAFAAADKSDVATAYLHRSARTLAEIATIIGAPAERYQDVADGARHAWQAEFLSDDGSLRVQSQAAHVRALAFDLVPDDVRPVVAERLVELVATAGGHLATGFLSTGLLLPALADNGHLDTAYALLLQDTEPSWLTMIDRGATTMWERWNGVDAKGTAHESLNHYSKGAVISFLHGYVAGLVPTSPGFRTFRVAPQPGGGLTSAQVHHECPYGAISVRWQVSGTTMDVDVQVPGGTSAELVLPHGTTEFVGAGSHHRTCGIRAW